LGQLAFVVLVVAHTGHDWLDGRKSSIHRSVGFIWVGFAHGSDSILDFAAGDHRIPGAQFDPEKGHRLGLERKIVTSPLHHRSYIGILVALDVASDLFIGSPVLVDSGQTH